MMKILVVDDIKENLYMLEALLQGYGYEVKSATDGVEALEKASQEEFVDMIISDILMPRMDGFQLCRKIKRDERLKKTSFVFYTATYTEPSDEEFALSLGAEKFIIKPIEPDKFMEILREVIRSYERGTLVAPKSPIEDESVYLKEYNERLIRKLEDKMSDLERVNKRLRESEEKYRELVNNANDAVIIIEPTGYLSFANPKFCEMTGYSKEEARGVHFNKLIYPDDLDMVTEYFRKRLAGEEAPRNYEVRLLTKTGETIYVDNSTSSIEKESRIVGILAIMRDITQRKRAEEEKEKIQTQLLQVQKMEAIGALAGGVAHDFNNLLTAIGWYTDLMMTEVEKTSSLYKDLKQIRLIAKRAASLTRQLLLFSRKQPIELTFLDINRTIDDLLKMLNRLIGEDIVIHTDLDPSLWTVRADAGNIEQVIMNLVVNARDAMPKGGKLTIKTENVSLDEECFKVIPEARPGKFICLSVMDTGIGMDKEIIQHIFEPFFSTKKAGKGIGLGLSVVYGIVKQHEGWINVYSEVGQGSTFKVYLPAFFVKPVDESKEAISLEDLQGNGERILVVEDEGEIRELVARVLDKNNYIVFKAANAKEAMDIFEREEGRFHLIFSDVVLSDKGGLQLADYLLSRNPQLRVLLSSGYIDEKSQWSIIHERGFRFLQKPYTLLGLLQAIREALEID
jgi:PAS domain S-box-containing protein